MPTPDPAGRIAVPGRGAVRVQPDIADVRLGAVIVRPTAADARSAAASTMDAILAALRAGGVAPRDLRTTLLSLDAVRDYSDGSQRITGYQLSNTVEATIRSIASTGLLVDAALAAGATSLDGLTFRLDDPTDALAEARRLAVRDARARAETLAAEAGVALGRVVSITEGGALPPGPPRPIALFRAKAASDASTPVESGTSEIAVEVTVEFAID
ncbi:MAG TPA: SIMPL domain-containing protein [Candidatus Limnocylindrales bacterium]|nr:SIMPL domain-containing protein [Candidatus Limnocylindrales bacterium]